MYSKNATDDRTRVRRGFGRRPRLVIPFLKLCDLLARATDPADQDGTLRTGVVEEDRERLGVRRPRRPPEELTPVNHSSTLPLRAKKKTLPLSAECPKPLAIEASVLVDFSLYSHATPFAT